MKKIILTVLVTLGVAAIACGFIINGINIMHEEELAALKVDHQIEVNAIGNEYDNVIKNYNEMVDEYYKVNDELCDMKDEMEELYEQVYKMQNGEAYEVRIEHDGAVHIWESDMEGLFPKHSHSIMRVSY